MKTKNTLHYLGLGLIALSLTLFLLAVFVFDQQDSDIFQQIEHGGIFTINFGISIVYFLLLLVKNRGLTGGRQLFPLEEKLYVNALVLFSLSAHTLNYTTEIQVFAPYIQGMVWFVVMMHVAIMLFPYRQTFPAFLQYAIYFINGAGLVVAVYMSLFLGPLIVWAIPGAIILGISLHALVPVWFAILLVRFGLRMEKLKFSTISFWAGVLFPLLLVAGYLSTWHSIQKRAEEAHQLYEEKYLTLLPEWVVLSQHLPDHPMLERVLMSEARSQKSFWVEGGGLSVLDRTSAEEHMYHDPLSVVSSLLYPELPFDSETILHLLESRYDARHMTHRRLWRGSDLHTKTVDTDIQIYPDYRLAYVEKVLTIHNSSDRSWRSQEAVYSFHLPEGSVVTSLSLWIEGEERPSRLTTRGKADSAYVEIVGVEARDPALLHWQEGNRVTVTVFPCTPSEDRQFKVGFTVPLVFEDEQLVLRSIPFDGPDVFMTQTSTEIEFVGDTPDNLSKPLSWNMSDETISYSGRYVPNWKLSFDPPALSTQAFSFGGFQYRLAELTAPLQAAELEEIILDINREWNWFEMKAIWARVKNKEVYVFHPNKIRLTEENMETLFQELSQQHFSLLPIQLIEQPEKTLVISHSPEQTPMLADLKGSAFEQRAKTYFLEQTERVRWFNLGGTVSPYLRSLKEFRVIQYAAGDIEDLEELLDKNSFPSIEEHNHLVALQHSHMSIQKSMLDEEQPEPLPTTSAPDHLLRLFAYNELMRDIGKQYFDRAALEDRWIRKAEEAFVVSPISSLVVLETRKDYERFGIDENRDTLGNASLNSSGAVPEPHEWMLILLVSLAAFWTWKKRGN
ncbi:MAG: XrtN system VIT domain-containing protein [Bacteroidota bacterium]